MKIGRRWLLGSIIAIAAIAIGNASAFGAIGGSIPHGGAGIVFQQAIRELDGTVTYLSSYITGVSVVDCADEFCRESSTHDIIELSHAVGLAAFDGGFVISGWADDNPSDRDNPRLLTCEDVGCQNTLSNVAAPAAGELHLLSDASLLIVGTGGLTHCLDVLCSEVIQRGKLPVERSLDVDLQSNGAPVILTPTSVVTCSDPVCSATPSSADHDLTDVHSLSVDSDTGNPIIGLTLRSDDTIMVPGLARCGDGNCTTVRLERLSLSEDTRYEPHVVAGTGSAPDVAILHNSMGSGAVVLVSSPLACRARWIGEQYQLDFDSDASRSAHLRADGRWLRNVTGQTSVTVPTSDQGTGFRIRHWFGDGYLDVPCIEDVEIPSLGCTVERSDAGATIRFDGYTSSMNLRVDGRWLATVTDRTSFVDSNPGTNYTLVRRPGGGPRWDYPCQESPLPTCARSATADGGVRISWADVDGTVVLRRNGRWLTTPTPGAEAHIDAQGSLQLDYTLRAWFNSQTFIDYSCPVR